MTLTWRPTDDQRLALAHINEHPEGCSTTEVALWAGFTATKAQSILTSLYSHGMTERERRGKNVYYLPLTAPC